MNGASCRTERRSWRIACHEQLLDVALFSPHLLLQAFNPLSTNLAALALCLLAWLAESAPAGEMQPH